MNHEGYNLPRRGRPAKPLYIEVIREITDEDLIALVHAPKLERPTMKKLRSVHFSIAKLLSSGMTNIEVAIATGRTPEGISLLQKDPAFQQLLTTFQDSAMQVHLDDVKRVAGKLADIAEMAVDEIAERLEDDTKRQQLPLAELRQLGQMALDRTVAPPKAANNTPTAPVTVTLDFGGRGFRNEQKTLDKPAETPMIDVTPTKE